MIRMIDNNIARLICGGEYGTAILTDPNHAITVYHCIKKVYEEPPAEIKLQIVVAGTGKEVLASVIETGSLADEKDEYVRKCREYRCSKVYELRHRTVSENTYVRIWEESS